MAADPCIVQRSEGEGFRISWPLSATGVTFQTKSDLAHPHWGNYGGTITNDSATIPLQTEYLFFRLKTKPVIRA
jgi:hypothetical protein